MFYSGQAESLLEGELLRKHNKAHLLTLIKFVVTPGTTTTINGWAMGSEFVPSGFSSTIN